MDPVCVPEARLNDLPTPLMDPSPTPCPRGRIFLVSHNFPPTLGPESSLVRLNAIDLARRGWQVSVLTTTTEHMHMGLDFGMLEGLPAGMEILRTPSYDAVLRKKWPRLGRLVLTLLHYHLLPEIFLLWLFSAVPAGRRWMEEHGPAILYSRATKHVSNVAAGFIKRATGMPWVAHISDPWVYTHLNGFQRWFAEQWERRVFRDADAIVIVSQKLADYILRLYPWARHKVHVIPHGYAAVEAAPAPAVQAGGRPMVMLHAGAFLPGYREPHQLFEALALLNRRTSIQGRFKAVFVGEDTARYQELADSLGISGVVDLLPSMPYQKCQQMIAESDLLLVLDAPHTGGIFLPTKLIEYLAHQKPVLGLSEPGSTVHEVLKECDLAFADQTNPEEMAEVIEKLIQQWEAGSWGVSEASKAAGARYQIDHLNQALDAILLDLHRRHIAAS